MSTKKQVSDWKAFMIFERTGLLVALSISWVVLISTPVDLLLIYLDPKYIIAIHNMIPSFLWFMDWLNDFFSYWRDIWQWPVIFFSMFFIVGRILFKDWKKTNLLIWVSLLVAYLNLIFFNTSFNADTFTVNVFGFVLYPMIILAPANLSIYPEFGALLFIAGYDLLRRSGFDTHTALILKGDKEKNALDKVIDPNI